MMTGAALAAIGMALTAHVDSLAAVVALRLVLGVGEAAFFVAGFAFLADLRRRSGWVRRSATTRSGCTSASRSDPPLGELLIDRGGFTAAWYGGAVLAVVAGVLVLVLRASLRATRTSTGTAG